MGSSQGVIISLLPRDYPALFVPPHNLLTLKRLLITLRAPMQMAAVVLKNSASLGVITINWSIEDVSLTSMTAQGVMDVNTLFASYSSHLIAMKLKWTLG